jgi:plasmid maintenance system antidote protein VapI
MEDPEDMETSTGFQVMTTPPPVAVVGLRNMVNERKQITSDVCAQLKARFNAAIDEACGQFTTCTDDKRSFFSWAYLVGAVPQSIEEVIKSQGEITQETVDRLLVDFDNGCRDANQEIQRIIVILAALKPSEPVDDLHGQMQVVDRIDGKIRDDLQKAPTWMGVIAQE